MAGMNEWLAAAILVLLGLFPCGIVVARAKPAERLIAIEMAGMISSTALLLLAKGSNRPSFVDLALTLAIVSIPGTLLFAHYLERWR